MNAVCVLNAGDAQPRPRGDAHGDDVAPLRHLRAGEALLTAVDASARAAWTISPFEAEPAVAVDVLGARAAGAAGANRCVLGVLGVCCCVATSAVD